MCALNFLEIVSLIILGLLLSLFCYLVVEYAQRQLTQRPEQAVTPHREADEQGIERLDHLFDIGLVLLTVFSAAELQYVSVQTEFMEAAQRNMMDVTFTFRVLTIPLVFLILFWIVKELIPQAHLRIVMRNFCWGLFSMILSFEGLFFVVLAPFSYPSLTVFGILLLFSYIFTISIVWTYRGLGSESMHFPSRLRSLVWPIGESSGYVSLSYFIIVAIFLLSVK